MKHIFTILTLLLMIFSCKNHQQKGTTTYYLIRHAEKQSGNDPLLTEKGTERANFWSQYFKDKNLDAVYSTDTKRTLATARPTAQTLELEIKTYDAKDMYNSGFKEETEGKTVLVVGHSNTTPQFVNKILSEKRYQDIADNEFGTVFKVTVSGDNAQVEKEIINSWDTP